MIESAAYDIIKQDGIEQGMILNAREMLIVAIEARFGEAPGDVSSIIEGIDNQRFLRLLHKTAITCENIDVLRQKLTTEE